MKNFPFLIVLLAISITFLACDGGIVADPICKAAAAAKSKVAAKGFEKSFEGFEGYKRLEELDPSCKSEEKNFVVINDTNTINPPSGWDKPEDYDSCIGLPSEEADACVKSIKDKKYEYLEQWRSEHKKRDLPIPCVAVEGVTLWGAWLTDEEIAGLVETYGVSYDDGNYEFGTDGENSPPPTVCGKY